MAKVRSPNYPMLSLGDAIKRVKAVYDSEHLHAAPREVIAKALGYSSLNGTSLSVVSALIKYGLLEAAGENLKVSVGARDIILHDKGEPERAQAVCRAAFLPALFNELHAEYGDRPPSDHALSVYLNKKFFNPKSVAGVIQVYRDTMEFVNEESLSLDGEFDDDPEAEVPMTTPISTTRSEPNRGSSATAALEVPADPGWITTKELRFTLLDGAEVRALFQGPVTQESIDMFKELLDISKRGFPVIVAPAATTLADGEETDET